MSTTPADHRRLAENLRSALAQSPGETAPALRLAAAARAAGGTPLTQPFDNLARQIGEAASRVTDSQVSLVRTATGSDKATFEIVMAAAIGAGLERWDLGLRSLEKAADAAP